MNHRILKLTLVSAAIMGVLHYIGSTFYFFWTVTGFDSVVHFVGGVTIGLFFIYLYQKFGGQDAGKISEEKMFFWMFVFVMVVSLGWEKYEYFFDVANSAGESYLADTTYDLLADAVGAFLAGYLGHRQIKYEH